MELFRGGRDLEVLRHHLRLGFYGGSDGRGHTWEAVNIAGCWATAESEMNKRMVHDVVHVAGGLTGTITNLHGVENWTSTEADSWTSATWRWTRTPLRWTPRCCRSARATRKKPRTTTKTKG